MWQEVEKEETWKNPLGRKLRVRLERAKLHVKRKIGLNWREMRKQGPALRGCS